MNPLLPLNCILALGLGSVFFLPSIGIQNSAIIMDLPPWAGNWTAGLKEKVDPRVKEILQAKAYENCTFQHEFTRHIVRVGIVLSSDNVSQSIHRPERCLPAQGQHLLHSSDRSLPLKNTEKPLHVTRLLTEIRRKDRDGTVTKGKSITYYWFVGRDTLTSSHYKRTFTDIYDRLVRGYGQRWAYITLATALNEAADNEAECDQAIVDLIRELVPHIVDPAALQ